MFIDLEGVINARELGGIKTADGKSVRSQRLFRTGELEKATDRDLQRLCSEWNIRCVVDFRDPGEAEERPDRDVPGAICISYPALPPMEQPKDQIKNAPPPDADKMFPKIYRDLAESDAAIKAYRGFFEVLLSYDGAPILWHCRQGKDRTGIAAILLLTALGVPMEQCIREYLLTNDYMQPRVEKYRAMETVSWKREMMELISFVREDWLGEYIQVVNKRFGGLENYLRDVLLLSDENKKKLRAFYLE